MGLGINDCMPEKPPTKSSALDNLRGLIARARAREQESDSTSARSPRATGSMIDVCDLWAALSEKNEEVKDYERTKSSFFRPRGLFSPFEDIGDVLSNTLRDVTNAAEDKEQIEGVGFFTEEELESACNDVFSITIHDFLAKYGMLALYPLLVYTYSVQGYGSIETESAYYGMVCFLFPCVRIFGRLVVFFSLFFYNVVSPFLFPLAQIWITPGEFFTVFFPFGMIILPLCLDINFFHLLTRLYFHFLGSMLKEVRDFFDPPEKGSTEDIISTVNIVDKGWLTLFEKIVEKDLAGKIMFNASIEGVQREL